MNQKADSLKRAAARGALERIRPLLDADGVVGVGTGSTANHFIDALAGIKGDFRGAVSSSEASTKRLTEYGIDVLPLPVVERIVAYVDGADEVDPHNALIKGGGGALTREKIVAAASDAFVCIVDESKLVSTLGAFPLPIEVIPMAQALVSRKLAGRGLAVYRDGFETDNGNVILDMHGFSFADGSPRTFEDAINAIPGVVCNGIFAHHRPDVVLIAREDGVEARETQEEWLHE